MKSAAIFGNSEVTALFCMMDGRTITRQCEKSIHSLTGTRASSHCFVQYFDCFIELSACHRYLSVACR
jgi:hypothetical protein